WPRQRRRQPARGAVGRLTRRAGRLSEGNEPPAGPHPGGDSGEPQTARSRWGGGSVLATFAGVLLLALGGFVAVWALAGGSGGPPAEAQQIPRTVGTTVPPVHGQATAAPLAASPPLRIEIPVLKVNAPVTRLGLNPDGSVAVPPLDDHNLA